MFMLIQTKSKKNEKKIYRYVIGHIDNLTIKLHAI